MRILVSNDDGYDATGILTLTAALREIAHVVAVAPLENHSGASSSMSLLDTISISKHSDGVIAVHGTPTDCVQLALHGPDIIPWKPDLTVTGINMGGNLGDDTFYSGTVAAAAESSQAGVPSIAFSLACIPEDNFPPSNFPAAAVIARELVTRLQGHLLAHPGMMLNINIPDLPASKVLAPIVCPLGRRHPGRPITEISHNPSGSLRKFSFDLNHSRQESHPLDDFEVVESNHIAITPLQFNLTDDDNMETVTQWIA